MSAEKNVLGLALLAKTEPTYSGSVTLSTSADAVAVSELPEFTIAYAYDGTAPNPQGIAGKQIRRPPSGRTTSATVKMEAKGLGATYTTSSLPPAHYWLLAAGLSGSLQGAQWIYKPTGVDGPFNSLAIDVYSRGEKRSVKGAYCDFTLGSDSAAPAILEFPVQGLIGLPDTVSAPTVSYSGSAVIAPNSEGLSLSIGGTTSFKVRSYKFEQGRELSPRVDLANSGGHAGLAPGRRAPKFSVTVEATALSTFNPYSAYASGTQYAITLTLGSVAKNKISLSMPQAQVMAVTDGADGPVATWAIDFDVPASGIATDDDFSLTYL